MKIITITLNPAYDVHCHAERFAPYHENLATVTSRDAGGKGVNISRALTQNGISNTAVVVLGEENAADFCSLLEGDGLCYQKLTVSGRIRENITIHCNGFPETRISFKGFTAERSLLNRIEHAIGKVDSNTVVTLTGRVAEGLDLTDVKAFLARLQGNGAKIVIDSRSFSLTDLIECRPWLIKPNEEELAAYLGGKEATSADVRTFGRSLFEAGIANVMVSLGEHGAYLYCEDGFFKATPPRVTPVSTIGAGDSSIAGFLTAFSHGRNADECLLHAVAFGTAACLTNGTCPPQAQDVFEIFQKVVCVRKD